MSRMATNAASVICYVALLMPSIANADPRAWDVETRASYVVIGGGRETGGLMPSLSARHLWAPSEKVDLTLGARLGLFGLGGGSRWIGVLGGPTASAGWHPSPAWTLGAGVDFDVGRIPVCNAWGLCMRYVGLFPAAEIGGAYAVAAHAEITAALTVRVISTWAVTAPTFEPAAGGRVFW